MNRKKGVYLDAGDDGGGVGGGVPQLGFVFGGERLHLGGVFGKWAKKQRF